MMEKLQKTEGFIRKIIAEYKKPAVMCSFGKDSLVMLHILRNMKLDLPVIFWKLPFFQRKHEFAEKIIRDWDLTIYDWPPARVGFDCVPGVGHAIQYQQMKGQRSMALAMGVTPFKEGEKFLCVVRDLFGRPKGIFEAPWDVCFHGHKSVDLDPVGGPVPLSVELLRVPESTDYAYPLREWTDADIFDYCEQFAVPINLDRYEKSGGRWHNIEDKTKNPDYYPACWRCVDKNLSKTVFCPLEGHEIENMGDQVVYDKLAFEYLGRN